MRCEDLTNPLGIDVEKPMLNCVIESVRRGVRQTAYQIGAMYRLAIMPQRLLREAFGVADSLRTFSPRIPATMERSMKRVVSRSCKLRLRAIVISYRRLARSPPSMPMDGGTAHLGAYAGTVSWSVTVFLSWNLLLTARDCDAVLRAIAEEGENASATAVNRIRSLVVKKDAVVRELVERKIEK